MKCFLLLFIFLMLNCVNRNDNLKNEKDLTGKGFSYKTNNEVALITEKVFNKQIIANGKIEAFYKSEMRFKTNEQVVDINVKNGQKVAKGQILASLDNAILLNKLNKAKIDFDKAKSKLNEEKINFGLGNTPDENIAPAILKNLQIKSGYLETQNILENAQLLYDQTILKTPFNGVVANIETKIGSYITSGDIFCTIVAQHQLEVVFAILENELSFVHKEQDVEILSIVDEHKIYRGTITEINPLVDENGLIKLKAKINTSEDALYDGMHVKVIINQPIANVIVVPKEAVVLRSNREVVFTLEKGLAKWNYVEVLDENSTSYAIKSGLKISDTIIVSGNMNLSHDAKVNATSISQQKELN